MARDPAAGAGRLGRYELVRKFATGGMAEVFLAKAAGPGGFEKTLVIKRILPNLAEDPDFVQMFLHEARLAAQFNHPNVVQIFDFGEAEGAYFLAMELVDGPNLRTILRKAPQRQIPLAVGARIVALACDGLAYAHEFTDPATGEPLGLVHRDVSSDNLLVGRNGTVKVVDFGVAKVAGQASNTAAGTVKGKIAYMPPEQILGGSDHRADVYALGVILYELAAGTRPYDQLPDVQMIAAVLRTEPVPLLTRVPHLSLAYARIVEKAMARNVEARYQDCRALAAALDDFIVSTGERVGTLQIAQFVAASTDSLTSTSQGNLRAVGPGSSPGSGSSPSAGGASVSTPASGSNRSSPATPAASSGAYRGAQSVMGTAEALSGYPHREDHPLGSGVPSGQSGRFEAVGPDPGTPWAELPPPFLSSPSPVPEPATGVLKGRVGQPTTPEARAHAVLADVESLRIYEAGAPLYSAAEQASVNRELERDDALGLLTRFPLHTARLLHAHPDAPTVLGQRVVGCVEGLLLAEAYGRLAQLLERLEAASSTDDNCRWMYETARAALARPEQVSRLVERLREARPADEGLGKLLRFFGGEFAELWIAAAEAPELASSRELLLSGLAELAQQNPAPFLARVLEDRPRRLADFVFVLEKARVADRQRAFRAVLGRRDAAQRVEVVTGLARAATEDGCSTLAAALGERSDAVRMQAIELLAQHFPDRVYRLLEPSLKAEAYASRSPAERALLWRAVGSSTLPDGLAVIAEVLRQKPTLLGRSKVEGLKLEALEGVAPMKTPQAAEFLRALTADTSQPPAVVAAAMRLLSRGPGAFEPARVVEEARRWDRLDFTPRSFLLDLFSLSQSARMLDVASPLLATAFFRLRTRLDQLLKTAGTLLVRLSGTQIVVNAEVVQERHEGDVEMDRVVTAFTSSGIAEFTVAAPCDEQELQQLVRWLAAGAAAEGVHTPNITRLNASGAVDLPARTCAPPPPMPDPSREAMVRYVDLIFDLRAFLSDKRAVPTLTPPESRTTLEELAAVMETRRVRFLGLTPWSIGRDAVAFHHANVLVLALGFAAELGFSRERLTALAEYAAFHDVGMYELNEETLQRPGDLTPGDKRALTEARLRSAWFPFTRLGDSPRAAEWVCVVTEHGLDWGARDRAGMLKQRSELGLLGSIVSLSKVYDALTSRRSYRAAMSPPDALNAMTKNLGHRFRPDMLQLFLRYLKRQSVRVQPRR